MKQRNFTISTGIYIKQTTIVGERGDCQLGKKIKRGKKKGGNYTKKGGKALKMHLFGL